MFAITELAVGAGVGAMYNPKYTTSSGPTVGPLGKPMRFRAPIIAARKA